MNTVEHHDQTAAFDGKTLTISRRGFGAAFTGGAGFGAGRGDHSLPLSSITVVETRDGITEFYVRFRIEGHNDFPSTYHRPVFGNSSMPFETAGMQRSRDPFHVRVAKGSKKASNAIDGLKEIAEQVQNAIADRA